MAGTIQVGEPRTLTNDFTTTATNDNKAASANFVQTVMAGKLPSLNPTITGVPSVPDCDISETSQRIANTKFVVDVINSSVGPSAFRYEESLTLLMQNSGTSTLRIVITGGNNFQVNWGDGTSSNVINGNNVLTKTYPAGVFEASATGTVTEIKITCPTLIDVPSFGNIGASYIAFNDGTTGCANLISVPYELPGTVVNMTDIFKDAPKLNSARISNWNVSNVITMNGAFENCTMFNQDLSSWCVTNIPSEPTRFRTNTPAWTKAKPIWGTCP